MAQRGRSTPDPRHARDAEAGRDAHVGGGAGLEELVASRLRVLFRSSGDALAGNVYEQVIQRVERPLLTLALEHTGGNQLRAAELLGLNRNTLRKKIASLGIYSTGGSPDADGTAGAGRIGPRRAARSARARRR